MTPKPASNRHSRPATGRQGTKTSTPEARHRRENRKRFYDRPLSKPPLPGEVEATDNEDLAQVFLEPWLWPTGERHCPRCGHDVVYDLADGRLRCPGCGYTFTSFNGRWINTGNITAADWLFLTRLFVEGLNVHQASQVIDMSYNAVFKAFTAIRFAILSRGIDAPQLFGAETGLSQYIRNKRIRFLPRNTCMDAAPVFGILERGGWVFTDIIVGYQYDTLFHLNLGFHLPLARAGNIVYTGRFRQYQTLISCTDKTATFPLIHPTYQPDIETHPDSFWCFALERLKLFKGITPSRFPLYLKEIEFRFNYAMRDLMPLVLEWLCDPVPEVIQEPLAYPVL